MIFVQAKCNIINTELSVRSREYNMLYNGRSCRIKRSHSKLFQQIV